MNKVIIQTILLLVFSLFLVGCTEREDPVEEMKGENPPAVVEESYPPEDKELDEHTVAIRRADPESAEVVGHGHSTRCAKHRFTLLHRAMG